MKKLIIANWKMNPVSLKEAESFFSFFKKEEKNIKNVEVVICPPFVYIESLAKRFKIQDSRFKIGSQDCFWENQGAYTGEISPVNVEKFGRGICDCRPFGTEKLSGRNR